MREAPRAPSLTLPFAAPQIAARAIFLQLWQTRRGYDTTGDHAEIDASRRGATALEISASHEGVERYMKNAQDSVPALAFVELNERWGDHLPGNPAAHAERQIDGSGWLPAPIRIAANDDQANNTLPVAAEQSAALGRAVLPARPAPLFRI
jgi:hypothetical protein